MKPSDQKYRAYAQRWGEEIAHLRRMGFPLVEIAQMMNQKGIRQMSGRAFSEWTLREIWRTYINQGGRE